MYFEIANMWHDDGDFFKKRSGIVESKDYGAF